MIQPDKRLFGNRRFLRLDDHPASVGTSSLGAYVAAAIVMAVATHAFAQPPSFPPVRHGIKAVFGPNGNDHGGDLENAGKTMAQAFHDLGADLTRIEFKWAIVEKNRGQYDWTEPDRLIRFLNSNGIEPMLMLYCAPKWAMRGTPTDEQLFIERGNKNLHTVVWPRRNCLRDFERFCETAARRYRGKAKLFEFWNEPDGFAGPIVIHDKDGKAIDVRYGGDANEYTYWLKRMVAAVKRGNPEAQVAAGSLCIHDTKFIEALYAAGCASYCDAISLHPYAKDGVNVEWIQQVRAVMCQYGDWNKPIWLSEFGWNKGGEYDEKNQTWNEAALQHAEIITRTAPVIESIPYITQAYWFTLNDWNTSETGIDPTGTHGYGLMSLDLKRRPAFDAFRKALADAPRQVRKCSEPKPVFAPPANPIDITDDDLRFSLKFNGAISPQSSPIEIIASDLDAQWDHPEKMIGRGETEIVPFHAKLAAMPGPGVYPVTVALRDQPLTHFLISQPAVARQYPMYYYRSARMDRQRDKVHIGQMDIAFGWHDTHLTLGCWIQDESHEQPHKGLDLWKGDCVQFAIDPMRDAIRGSRYDDNDSEFAIALTEDGPAIWRYRCPVNSYGGAMPTEWVNVTRVGHKTLYSARIPWIDIGVENPQPGRIIGVAVAGCDWNSGERTVYRFGDGIIGGKEPYRFASIVLKGAN